MKRAAIAVALIAFGAISHAQVHRCIDASGKATFSDTPCPTSATRADQVLGSDATAKRNEPADAGYRRNMESINRSRAALADSVSTVTRQSQAPDDGGPAIMDAPPNQQTRSILSGPAADDGCQTQSSRKGCIGGSRSANPNWSPQRGYYGGGGPADQQYEREQEQARQAAAARPSQPALLTNCNAGGCWDTQGNRYNTTGDGSRFVNSQGRMCTTTGKYMSCN